MHTKMTKMTKTKKVPAQAFTFAVGEFELGNNGEAAKSAPFSMTARSGKPISHPYWGNIVHDFAGMQLHKNRIPIDYCHDSSKIIGYANKFNSESGDLVASGALVPYGENDLATEIIYKQKHGIPYEASISFAGGEPEIEEIEEGETAQVNGYELVGPAVIVRKWNLRGIAVCPYGADMNTDTSFSSEKEFTVKILNKKQENNKMTHEEQETVEAKELTEENSEAVETEENAEAVEAVEAKEVQEEAELTAEQTEQTVEEADVDSVSVETEAELTEPEAKTEEVKKEDIKSKFVNAFGKEKAAIYLFDELSYEDALAEENKQLKQKIQELESKTAKNSERGIAEAVQFKNQESKPLPTFLQIAKGEI